jgi:hypothetical protein
MSTGTKLEGKGRRMRLWFAVAGVLLIVGGFMFFRMREATPMPVEARFLSALEREDWAGIYDMSVQEQFGRSGVTRQEFVELMASLSDGLPTSYFKGATLERMGGKEDDYSRGYHAVLLTFMNGPLVEGSRVEQILHVKRDRSGWRIAPNELPFRLARLHGGDGRMRAEKLAQCMERAGIEEFWLTMDGPVMSTERLRAYLRGEIDWSGVQEAASRR